MAAQKTHVQVGRRTLQLSNLDKILYPKDGFTKAEIIQYYLEVAPFFLRYGKYRPLSLVRYPEGVGGEEFFQKDLPQWRPDWITHFRAGKERKKDYVTVTEEATLVWLANLACLELHQLHYRSGNPGKPDYIVYDLDPPEGLPFSGVKEIALSLKNFLERFGYHVYLKTSGGKGLHLVTPVIPEYSSDECFEAAQDLASQFVKQEPSTTLAMRKDARKGRILIDIFRNRESQTIIAAYSLRGREGAPVSFPILWEDLESLESSGAFTLVNAMDTLRSKGDVWEGMDAYAVHLHTHITQKNSESENNNPPGEKHKTPQQLANYQQKRDFLITPEPIPSQDTGEGHGFVVHRHDASHLHYDLRIEKDGVLMSWAVPKGMPAYPGDKRLAVQTEDHPLKYLQFEGEIPKGEYGGGLMLICARGRYTITKKKKDGFYFTLSSHMLNGEFRIHKTKNNEWLLERVDVPSPSWLEEFNPPMLAEQQERVPMGENLRYELKWDGIRASISIRDGRVKIYSRGGHIITNQFPELNQAEAFRVKSGVFDGEIVCFDDEGKPDFKKVMKRFQAKGTTTINRLAGNSPAFLYLFDVLYTDGVPLINHSLGKRRLILEGSIRLKTGNIRLSDMLEDGEELFEATRAMGLEGIMCKDITRKYSPGKRMDHWVKVKVRNEADVEVVGFTYGKGSLQNSLGALHLIENVGGEYIYRGKVGTGFTDAARKKISKSLSQEEHLSQATKDMPVPADNQAVWLKYPKGARVRYASVNPGGVFREPVFISFI